MKRTAFALALLALPAAALAAAGDYDPSSADWNGLSNLVALAESEGLTVVAREELDWGELQDGDVLVLLYPKTPVEPAHVMSFLRSGGRLLVADDYGTSQDTLARLSMLRKTGAVHADRYHESNDALPVARAIDRSHPLARDVGELYTNYPAWFHVEVDDGPETVFTFGRGEAVVVAGSVGDGRFVALSDPSVLINAMMAFDENVQFASNLIDFLRRRDVADGRLVVLSGDFILTGEPPATLDEAKPQSTLNELLSDFGKFLDELNDYLASKDALWGVGMVGATIFMVLVALFLLPSSQQRLLDGSWTRARTPEERVDFERFVAYYEAPGAQATFAYPAGVLRDGLEQRIAELAGIEQPLVLVPGDLYARLEGQVGARAAKQFVADVLPRILVLPTRAQAQSPWGARFVGWKEFAAAHDAAQAFEAYCGSQGTS